MTKALRVSCGVPRRHCYCMFCPMCMKLGQSNNMGDQVFPARDCLMRKSENTTQSEFTYAAHWTLGCLSPVSIIVQRQLIYNSVLWNLPDQSLMFHGQNTRICCFFSRLEVKTIHCSTPRQLQLRKFDRYPRPASSARRGGHQSSSYFEAEAENHSFARTVYQKEAPLQPAKKLSCSHKMQRRPYLDQTYTPIHNRFTVKKIDETRLSTSRIA